MRRNECENRNFQNTDLSESVTGKLSKTLLDRSVREETENKENQRAVNDELSLHKLRLQFLANINHELRTPLNGLMGATDLLSFTSLSDDQRKYLDIFRRSNQKLLGLVENILDFSKMMSSELKLEKNRFDLKQLLSDCQNYFLPFAIKKNLKLSYAISEEVPRWIREDSRRLSQVLHHLIGNALKFTDHGEATITATMEGGFVVIAVRDTGIGVSFDKQALIFDAFYQQDSTHTRLYGGAGLGLAISRFLSRAMGGDLTMTSIPDRGSEFILRFPCLESQNGDRTNLLKRATVPKILLVEDNEIDQALAFLMFSKRGITIDIAENGLEALHCHRRNHYDLILMDFHIPLMDGIEATREIRAFDSQVTIVALCEDLAAHDKTLGLNTGINDFLAKPLDYATIEAHLERARNILTH